MPTRVKAESTLTERYQTTVPSVVRRALGLGKHDRILYELRPNGDVVLSRADSDGADPVLERFLALLAADMAASPERLRPVDPGLVERARALTEGVELDLDAPLRDEDA